jgi:hypothetical protein
MRSSRRKTLQPGLTLHDSSSRFSAAMKNAERMGQLWMTEIEEILVAIATVLKKKTQTLRLSRHVGFINSRHTLKLLIISLMALHNLELKCLAYKENISD